MKRIPLVILKIDQEKAFDRVNWAFLLKVLTKMNFSPHCIQIGFKVSDNGFLSRPVALSTGVRQGCPLSPLLYRLVAETLANLLCKNRLTDGLKIVGCPREIKTSKYTDNTTKFLGNTSAAEQALKLVHEYELGSGSKVRDRSFSIC